MGRQSGSQWQKDSWKSIILATGYKGFNLEEWQVIPELGDEEEYVQL